MNWLLRLLLLLLPLVASAQVEVRRYATMSDLLSANPASFAVAGRATVIVTGRTNLYDGWSRVLAYSSSDTNAANNQTIFSPSNTNFPGRYRLLYLENATNSAVRAGILPAYGANSFWYNGAWTPVSNIFVAGANSTVSVATNGVVTIASTASGSPVLVVDGLSITNGLLNSSQVKGSDISWSVEAGTNVVATIYNNTVTHEKIQQQGPGTLLGGVEGGASEVNPSEIQIGANLQMIGDTLSAIIPASTNSWQIEVGGVLTIEPDLVDTGRIDVTASGSSVSFDLVSGSVSTNYLSAGVNSLLHAHNLAFTVNGTTVIDPNVSSSEEIAAAVASSTNVYFALNPGSVALSKLTNMVASRLLGRGSSGLGAVEPITVGTGLVLGTNGVLSATGTNSTVVRVGGTTVTDPNFLDTSEMDFSIDLATNISASLFNNSVVFSKLQQIATSRLLGRSTAGSGNIEQILIGSGLSLTSGTLSATGSGGGSTNGTAVYVDGVSVTGPNFTDATTTGLFDVSGTNVTIRLPDRDFGDISVGSSGASMTIDADSVALGTDTTGNYIATVAGTANEVTVSGSGSETAAVTVSLPSTIDLGGKTSFEVPNSTGPTTDAVGEIAVDSNAWASGRGALQIFDGTANTFAVGVLASDTPTNGQVPKWNTGGTITWEDDASTSGGSSTGDAPFAVAAFWEPGYFTFPDEPRAATLVSGSSTGVGDVYREDLGLYRIGLTSAQPAGSFMRAEAVQITDGYLAYSIGIISNATYRTTGTNVYVYCTAAGGVSNFETVHPVMIRLYSGSVPEPPPPAGDGSGGSSGTVTNVAASTTVEGLGFSVTSPTITPSISLTGVVAVASGGTGSTNAAAALAALGGQASDSDLAALASAGSTGTGAFVRADSPTLSGTWSFDTLQLGTLTILTNLFVPADAYGAGWNGSSNTPAKNDVYDQMELRQPLDPDLTAMAAGTAVATAQTNAVSFGAPVLYAGSTNIAQHLALKAPLASPAFTTSATIGGTNVLDYIASHLTEAEASALYQRTNAILTQLQGLTGGTAGQIVTATGAGTFALSNAPSGGGTWDGTPIASGTITNFTTLRINSRDYYNEDNGDFWAEGYNRGVSASAFSPHLTGAAVASGSISGVLTTTNNPMAWIFGSSTTTNSGYGYYSGHLSTLDIGGGSEKLTFLIAINNTNKIQGTWGFSDSLTQDEPVDGAYFRMDNGYVHGVIANNSSYSRTITSNQLAIAASTFKRYEVETSEDASYTTFRILSPSGTGYVTNWTDSVTNSLPTGSTRLTSIVAIAINRDAPSLINLITLDAVGKRTIRILPR